MRILVTFALPQEFAPWRMRRPFARVPVGPLAAYDARIAGADVRVALTGIGQFPAVRVARQFLQQGADACISAGLAGGLRAEHSVGRVLVARALRMEDERFVLKSDDRLRRLAAVCGARAVECFFSAERVVVTAQEKAALGLVADAVEMESFAILTEAARCRVPAVAVRAISDTVRADLPLDFNRVTTRQGAVSGPRLLAQLVRRPYRLPALLRLGADTRRAAAALAGFLDAFVQAMAGPRDHRGVLARASAK